MTDAPAPARLTEEDRLAMANLTADWRWPPGCFVPNARARDQAERGLIELSNHEGRWAVRLTPLGLQLLACKGEA